MRLVVIVAVILDMLHPSFQIWQLSTKLSGGIIPSIRQENKWETCFKSEFQKGIPEHDFPSLEPLTIQNLTIQLEKNNFLWLSDATGSVKLKNLRCDGLNQWKTVNDHFMMSGFLPPVVENTFTAIFEDIKCKTDYHDLNLKYMDRNFFGNGSVKISLKNFSLDVTVVYKVLTKEVKELKIIPKLERMESFVITGLNSNSALSHEVSETIHHQTPAFIVKNLDKMDNWFQEFFSNYKGEEGGLGSYLIKKCIL